ncbi:MAG TPA: phage portal protein [Chloroflexota bacterium]|jgi:HK97 family phage portal protein|nr:phage portal protein [Chloroflexota bacterium]
MNVLTRALFAVGAGLKKFTMSWGAGRSWSWVSLGRTRYDDAANVDPAGNAAVQAVVLWVARAFPEAPLRVSRRDAKGNPTPLPDHPLVQLLASPNPYYSGVLLWMATLADWMLTGNAYWGKVRSGAGRPVELWWLPSRLVEPKSPDDGSAFLSHYEYRPDGRKAPVRVEPHDLVHFRYGIDPADPRKGLSPLASLAREVFTDDEAANFSAAILKNLGVPGVVISPDSEIGATKDEAEKIKADFRARFGGDNRGDALVMTAKTRVQVLSFSPEQMNLKDLRRLPEERISAIFGIPAIVVGLGAGLDRSTFANYAEAREAAYESNVIPTQRLLAAEIAAQLLPEFGDASRSVVDFDLTQVRVLQPDLDSLFKRLDVAVQGGWMFVNEARERVGLEPLPDGDVLYVKMANTPTPADQLVPAEPAAEEGSAIEEPAPLRALPPGRRRGGARGRPAAAPAAEETG